MIDELFNMNCSTIFLLHPLGLDRKQLKGTGFCNCYLRDETKPEYEGLDVVLLLFHVKNKDKFRFFVEKEKVRTPLFIDEYDYDEGYVVLVYEFPGHLKDDFERFKKGEYRSMSPEFLATFPKEIEVFYDGRWYKTSPVQRKIIERDAEWQGVLEKRYNTTFTDDMEFWQIMDIVDETVTIPPKKIAS